MTDMPSAVHPEARGGGYRAAGALAVILGFLSFLCCAAARGDDGGSVPDSLTLPGSVRLLDPAPFPQGAVLTVTLEDVSRADAPAVTVGQVQMDVNGQQPPIPFTVVYPASAVMPGAMCAARARVTLGDRLLFTTTDHYGVDALHPAPVELTLTPVPTAEPPGASGVPLTDTYWKLTRIDGQPVQVAEQMREPSLVLAGPDSRFTGSGGVNRLMGGYTLAGDSLTFSQVASTMMAGPPDAMQQEQAMIAALDRVRGFQIAGHELSMVDEAGQPVLNAVAVELN